MARTKQPKHAGPKKMKTITETTFASGIIVKHKDHSHTPESVHHKEAYYRGQLNAADPLHPDWQKWSEKLKTVARIKNLMIKRNNNQPIIYTVQREVTDDEAEVDDEDSYEGFLNNEDASISSGK